MAGGSERTAELVRLAIGRWARRLRQEVGEDLTPSQAAVLAAIGRHGPLTPSRLAEVERISRPTVTRLVAKLKARGLVEFLPDPVDRRSYQIAVSDSGSLLRGNLRERKQAILSRTLERADPGDVELLDRAAKALLRLLEEQS